MAGLTSWMLVAVTALALITTGSRKARATHASTGGLIAPPIDCAHKVAGAGSASGPHRPIESVSTLCAMLPSEPFLAQTLTCDLVALGTVGVLRVTGARLAASATHKVPVVGGALVACWSNHVGEAGAAPSLRVTWDVWTGTTGIAGAPGTSLWIFCTQLVESNFAAVAAFSLCVLLAQTAPNRWLAVSASNTTFRVTVT